MNQKLILGNSIVTEQPHMINCIKDYRSMSIDDEKIAQIYYFQLEGQDSFISTAIPDASTDLIFYKKKEHGEQGSMLVGPSKKFKDSYVEFFANCDFFGIRFKPGIPLIFGDILSKSMYEQIIFDQTSDLIYDRMVGNILAETSMKKKKLLIKNLSDLYVTERDDGNATITNYIINYLLTHKGVARLDEISEQMGYSAYYLNKVFHRETGYPIIQFYNMLRIHNLLNYYESYRDSKKLPNQVKLAYEFGFSDQAHMIREFKKYTESTPSKYWKEFYRLK